MAEQQTAFALPQTVIHLFEKQWAAATGAFNANDAFADLMNAYLKGMTQWQEAWIKSGETWLSLMNLPTREDVSRIAEHAIHLEERIEQAEDRLERLSAQEARIVYLEHELSTLRTELAALRTRLDDLEKAAAEPSAAKPAASSAAKSRKNGRGKNAASDVAE